MASISNDLGAYVTARNRVDTVVRVAGERADAARWDQLRGPNLVGASHGFEAARRSRSRGVVFPSKVPTLAGQGSRCHSAAGTAASAKPLGCDECLERVPGQGVLVISLAPRAFVCASNPRASRLCSLRRDTRVQRVNHHALDDVARMREPPRTSCGSPHD